MEENDQDHWHPPPFTISTDHASALSCVTLLNPMQEQGLGEHHLPHHQHQERQAEAANDLSSVGGPSSQTVLDQTNDNFSNNQCMSSKMRLMKKMLGKDQILVRKQRRKQPVQEQAQMNHASSSNPPSDGIRVCSNCQTTKTPLWRSGPQGPKSLCNACGIRQMKARRAMRAAAAATAAGLSTNLLPATNCKMQEEEEEESSVHLDRTVPFKKRFKIVASASAQKKLGFDDITVNLSNKLTSQQPLPQEEKDAAILLMALSCGLIHG